MFDDAGRLGPPLTRVPVDAAVGNQKTKAERKNKSRKKHKKENAPERRKNGEENKDRKKFKETDRAHARAHK